MSLRSENSQIFGFKIILHTIASLPPLCNFVISFCCITISIFGVHRCIKNPRTLISQYLLPYSALAILAHIGIVLWLTELLEPSIAETLFGYSSVSCVSWLLMIMIDMLNISRSERPRLSALHKHRSIMFRIYYFHSCILLPIILPIITTQPLFLEKFNAVVFVFYLVIRTFAISLYSLFTVFMTFSSRKHLYTLLMRNFVVFITVIMYIWSVPVLMNYSSNIVSSCWVKGKCASKICTFVSSSYLFKIVCSLFWVENILIILGARILYKYCELEGDNELPTESIQKTNALTHR